MQLEMDVIKQPEPIKDFGLFLSCLSESTLVSKFINGIDLLLMIINDQGHIEWWNQSCEKASGYSLSEVGLAPFWELLIPESRKEELKEKFFTWLANEKRCEHENEWRTKSGEIKIVRWINETVSLEDGKRKVLCSFGKDVTAEREYQLKLHEKEQALASSLSGFALSDLEGNLTYANPAFLEMWGYAEEEVLGASTLMFWEDKTLAIEVFNTLQQRHHWRGELIAKRKDGSAFPVEAVTFPVYSARKEIIGFGGSFLDISSRKELEQVQRRNEEVLRTLLNSIPESAFLMKPDATIVVANSTFASRFNFKSEKELEGVNAATLIPADVAKNRSQQLRKSLEQKRTVIFEDERFGRTIRNIYTPILDENGEVQLFSILALDITEDRLKDKALRESEQRYRALAEASQDLIFVVDKDMVLQYVNPPAAKAIQYPAEEIIGKKLKDLFPYELIDVLEKDLQEVFRNGKPLYTERLIVFPSGAAWLSTWLSPLKDENGEATAILGVSRDFTDKQLAQENYTNLFMSLQDGVALTALDGKFVDANPAFLDMVGYSLEELKNLSYQQITPERWFEMERRILEEQIFKRGFSDEYEKEYIHKSGEVIPVSIRVWLRKDFTGKLIGMWGIARDITEQKRIREELERNRAHLQAIFDNASVALMTVDQNGRYLECNERWEELLGYTREEILQLTNRDVTYPEDVPESVNQLQRLVNGEIDRYEMEKRFVRKDGSIFWGLLSATPIRNVDGEFQAAIGVVVDITERKAFEQALAEQTEALKRSNKELEQFAYIASHDLQEPLRMVTSYLQLIKKDYGHCFDENGNEFIHFAVDGAERMRMLIQSLLSYSRVNTQAKPFTQVSTLEVVQKVLDNLSVSIQEAEAQITIGELPTVYGDELQLTQLFQNLIANAIKFRGDRTPQIQIRAEDKDEEWLFSVSDNGIGFKKEHAKRIFDIFQRLHTRSEYEGTGIGLAICRKILERHGGQIWAESEPGQGSTFFFTLPKRSIT